MDRCGDELKPQAQRLRGYVVGILHDEMKKDTTGAAALEKAEATQAHKESVFASDWIRQISHPDGIIPQDELHSALLSEDVEALASIVKTMEQEQLLREYLVQLRTDSLDLIRKACAAGEELPGIEEKLKILGVAL